VAAVVAYLALAAGVGAVAGLVWEAVVDLPTYLVGADRSASISERGLTAVVAGDAWFTAIGAGAGIGLGWVGWRRLRGLGWPVVLVVLTAALVAALLCWLVGQRLGPGPLAPRLAAAVPGEAVPVELTLRARAALLVWPLAAVLPVLLGASLGRDEDDPAPPDAPASAPEVRSRWGRRRLPSA